ncbi:hypothetical protein [uncultured Thiodictyon sp.]|uniref:hypothetical protein n=1 Tax=uncultured Thiodictyon sp. TaxID=1846217 RepID=UPI0025CCB9E2|nr:hypothetical protein [uncultured Thiodictyon sp.]
MSNKINLFAVSSAVLLAVALAGCASNSARQDAATPAAGTTSSGQVVDSSKVEAGTGRAVKGIGDWEGEISGIPAANSKFTKLQIGMPMKQVTDLIGQPTDQGAYITGKAFIPFYFGGDKHRYELVYKGQGRLIFAGGSIGDFSAGHLIWIIHNANEPGYR